MTNHTFTMNEARATLIFKVVDSHKFALKNWIAGAVERGDLEGAQKMVAELREYEAIYAAFNMPAKHEIAKHSGKPLETDHTVRLRR